jgi:hypothetical protein
MRVALGEGAKRRLTFFVSSAEEESGTLGKEHDATTEDKTVKDLDIE